MKMYNFFTRLLICMISFTPFLLFSQDFYSINTRKDWMEIAEANTPKLIETLKSPERIVDIVKDKNAFQGYKAVPVTDDIKKFYDTSFKQRSGIILDFGDHVTGYFTFDLKTLTSTQDAPLRFKFTFGEVPSEVAVPFDPYTGGLSRAWLQDEIITVTDVTSPITIPRRLSFRYVKVELLGSSPYFDFSLSRATVKATTSAASQPEKLSNTTPNIFSRIDNIGLKTLKECMQTVFEDGPKRDRRLWIGDLYLQAMSNNYSYKQHDLTKRCLYLLAGLAQEDGFLYCNVFETPKPHAQVGTPFLFDYSLLFNALLKDYLLATNDRKTAEDLWPVAKRQLENVTTYLDRNYLFDAEKAKKDGWWLFVDWNDKLDRQTSIQGIIIFSMKETLKLAQLLGKEKEVSKYSALIDHMSTASKKHLYDKNSGLFISGDKRQISYASQAWMVLAGVMTKTQAKDVLQKIEVTNDAIRPGGPYLYHFYMQALIDTGLKAEAKKLMSDYWGGMANKEADTFWEVYDPRNEELSPYNFFPVNSYCHAWSCTPVYFIRKYPDIFQK